MYNYNICGWGYPPTRSIQISDNSYKKVKAEFSKNIQLENLLNKLTVNKNKTSSILFYPKSIDENTPFKSETVITSLKDEGFNKVKKEPPNVKKISTNAIWYSHNVPESEIKAVAYVLLRAGTPIKVIRRSSKIWDKNKIIVIGASSDVGNSSVLLPRDVHNFRVNRKRPPK